MKFHMLLSAMALLSLDSALAANAIINGGFEPETGTLDIPNGTANSSVPSSQVAGWETTDSLGRIEIWDGPFSDPVSGVTFNAYEGDQFAEINAFENSALYQDVIIDEAGLVNYGFAHRGRAGVDTLSVYVLYAGADGIFQTAAGSYTPQGDDVLVVNGALSENTFSTGNTAWSLKTRDDAFTSVAGGLYRFSYQAVSTASGNSAVGNLIDGVYFGVDAVPEPSTALLGAFALGGWIFRRRR